MKYTARVCVRVCVCVIVKNHKADVNSVIFYYYNITCVDFYYIFLDLDIYIYIFEIPSQGFQIHVIIWKFQVKFGNSNHGRNPISL